MWAFVKTLFPKAVLFCILVAALILVGSLTTLDVTAVIKSVEVPGRVTTACLESCLCSETLEAVSASALIYIGEGPASRR